MDAILNWLNSFNTWLSDWFGYVLGYISSFFATAFKSLLTQFRNLLDKLLDFLYSGLEGVFDLIGISDSIDLYNSFNGSGFGYYFDYFGVNELLGSAIAAFIIRFGIRRIPFIG